MFDSNNPHNDPKLAMKCYPSGNKRIATSKCICGSVEIRAETDDPVMTARFATAGIAVLVMPHRCINVFMCLPLTSIVAQAKESWGS